MAVVCDYHCTLVLLALAYLSGSSAHFTLHILCGKNNLLRTIPMGALKGCMKHPHMGVYSSFGDHPGRLPSAERCALTPDQMVEI